MDMRHPVWSLSWALTRALEQDLAGIDSPVVNDLLRAENGPIKIRPRVEDCAVVLFTQVWRAGDLGYERGEEQEAIDAETVVVTGPAGDACVYVATQLLYRVAAPNRRFFLDVAGQCMRGRQERDRYEGRDSADQEDFDDEVAGALARISGALRHLDPQETSRVARALQDCADAARATAGWPQGHREARAPAVPGSDRR